MSITKDSLWKKIRAVIGGIALIAGVVIAFFSDQNKAIIALWGVIVALLIIVGYAIYALLIIIQTEHRGEYLK